MSFAERLARGVPVVADGAWGTQLMARGLAPGSCPEAWNLDHAEAVEAISRSYLAAGAELLTTNSFGGTPLALERHGMAGRCAELNRAAVALVRRVAASGGAWVGASVGPTGRVLEPYGETSVAAAEETFARQIAALADAAPDLLIVETMIDLAEARAALSAANRVAAPLPVAVTMTFDRTPRGFFTAMGVSVEQAAAELAAAGATLVGANCGAGIDQMVEIAAAFRAATALPLLIQSNAGLPELAGGRLVYPDSPEHMAAGALRLAELGVAIIGGCCGTGPAHIAAIRAALSSGF